MEVKQKLTILYQGDCAFCQWCVALVKRNAKESVSFRFVALNSEEGKELIAANQLQVTPEQPDTIVVLEEGQEPLYKWRAGVRIAKETKWPFKVVYFLSSLIPQVIGDMLYNWVGQHRNYLCKVVRCQSSVSK